MEQPPVNALNPELLHALSAELDSAVDDASTTVAVLTSGLAVFSGGADAAWMREQAEERGAGGVIEEFVRTMEAFRSLCERIRRSPILVIAAVNGHALAGGLELAAACDIRFASQVATVQLGVPEMDLFGVMPSGGGGAQYLSRLMGASRALHFVLDAKPIDPQQAHAAGLVDRLVEPGELIGTVEEFAGSVATKAGRVGVAAAKRAILSGAELPLYNALEFDRAVHWDSVRRGNFTRGVDSFVSRFASRGR